MKRVLHVYPQLNCGGTEMVLYNLIKFGNHSDFQFDILAQIDGDNEKIFRDLGCNIHYIKKEPSRYYQDLLYFFLTENFDVVHAHMDIDLPIVLKAAKEADVKCRVAHSHNARTDIPKFFWPLLYPKHHPYEQYATDLFGCSSMALKWLFPSQWRNGHIIHNGIDLEKFRFNPETRRKVRKELSISDTTKVYINVGRCTEQKNQKFILEIASKRSDKDELFLIVGDGPLYSILSQRIKDLNLNNVILLGKCTNVEKLLSGADTFLFPSIYEGLGIVAVEAQASGLKVIASDSIPMEADMKIGNFKAINLKDIDEWTTEISNSLYSNDERVELSAKTFSSQYNIFNVTKEVENIYNSRLVKY